MKPRWLPGTWLGKRFSSEEHIIAMSDGRVVRARAVRALPDADSWSKGELEKIVGQPWNPMGTISYRKKGEEDVPRLPDIRPAEGESNFTPRGLRILPKHLAKVGHTEGCPKCRELLQGRKSSLGHNASCRLRVQEEMMRDPVLKQEVEAFTETLTVVDET